MASLATFRRSLAAAVRVRPAFANQRVAAFSSFSYVRQASQVQKPTETDSDPVIPGFRAEGEIATNYELATGNERYEYFKKLAGEEPWEDLKPIVLDQPGTKAKPITLTGVDPVRYVGCTGFPADSHEAIWLTLSPNQISRCPHCGNVFKYVRQPLEHDDEHH